ncbi:MAG: hypothetical protein OWQ59_01805 [Alicyclobacillaceae bacterium]|nr:hypothetical protein [Alicyclobacillaceae bacterium]MCY0897291.1 hypothetical protein [Alicyclobacillaceae bacterium]
MAGVTRAQVMPHMGRHVSVRTIDGQLHHGILHSVTDEGIYLRPVQRPVRLTDGKEGTSELLSELPQEAGDETLVWWPFLFFPWFWLAWFW